MRDEPADDAFVEAVRVQLHRAVFDEDAYDGGRTSVTRVERRDDGDWPELEVTWAVRRPGLERFAPLRNRGTLRVPVGRRWLDDSWMDADRYVGEVVRRVEHASRARPRRVRPVVRDVEPEVVAVHWRALVAELSSWGAVTEVGVGRLEVVPADDSLREQAKITVVVPPSVWAAAVEAGTVVLDDDPPVGSQLMDDDEVYLVWHDGGLVASTREELPPVRGTALARRIAEIRAEDPDAELGWYAEPPAAHDEG